MEWLEFERWSDEVSHKLAAQLSAIADRAPHEKAQPKSQDEKARQKDALDKLLRAHLPMSPWGEA